MAKETDPNKKAHAPVVHAEGEEMHAPFLPLLWLLAPLIAAVIYGLATR